MKVSFHAISRLFGSISMKLISKIGYFSLDILVDSGSTHNFLDPSVASAIKMRILIDAFIEVKVTNAFMSFHILPLGVI